MIMSNSLVFCLEMDALFKVTIVGLPLWAVTTLDKLDIILSSAESNPTVWPFKSKFKVEVYFSSFGWLVLYLLLVDGAGDVKESGSSR